MVKPLVPPPRVWRARHHLYRLVGGECRACGFRFYPFRPRCPKCGSRDVVERELPREGVVESFTVVYQVPEHLREQAPLAFAVIKLSDGTRVVGSLTEFEPSKLRVGASVEAVLRRVAADGDYGVIAYGVKWRLARFSEG